MTDKERLKQLIVKMRTGPLPDNEEVELIKLIRGIK